MKVAIFSDVHGNLPAMEAVVEDILAWQADLVILAGDLINRGPNSLACLTWLDELRRSRGWLAVRGNHEVWIPHCREPAPAPLEARMRKFADWTLRQIEPRLDALAGWSDHLTFQGRGGDHWVHVTHGTMRGNRHGVTADLPDEELRQALPPDIDLFVTAHTHRPLVRMIDDIPVINTGSASSPFDGDPRGSYARLWLGSGQWRWQIVRFAYDRERARQDFLDSGFIEEGGPLARILYEEWNRAHLLMPSWRRDYEAAVLSGACPLEQAVERFLDSLD